jgi:putative ABC transport system permease protein
MTVRFATPRWARRLRLLLTRAAAERSMDAEMRYHIECETAEHVGRGMTPDEARRQAVRDFGGIEARKDEARDTRGVRAVEDLWLDARHAARVLRRHGALTTAAVLTFALGIGAATAIFSIVYGILLRPLPYAHADRLVVIWERSVPKNHDQNVVSVDNFEAWRDSARAFDGMAGLMPRAVTVLSDGAPERVIGAEVSPGYFDLIGVTPAHGREFGAADATPAGPNAVILSDGYWRRHFGADPSAVGRALTVSGRALTIVGVMPNVEPPRFGWLGEQQLWFPFVASAENRAWGRFLLVVARLRDGVTLDRARAEMLAIADQRARDIPADRGWAVTVTPLDRQITGDMRTTLGVLFGAAGLLLAMAVVNVAMLVLSLTHRRAPELAMRRAIGATEARLFRQLFTQSALLGLLGAAVGLLTAAPAVRFLRVLLPPGVPRVESIRVDTPVLLAATVVAVAATTVFGAAAALRGRSPDVMGAVHALGGARTSARRRGGTLVAIEIALTLALTAMALLMARSFVALRAVDLGFAPDGVLMTRIALPADGYRSPASQRAFFASLLERVRALPGVESAGLISTRPFGGPGPATTVSDPAHPPADPTQLPVADVRYADAEVFRALRIRLTRGTPFDDRDVAGGPAQAVISESLARELWPGGDPIGRRMNVALFDGITATIVGVSADVHLMDARTPAGPTVYLSASRYTSGQSDLILRSASPPEALVPSLRAVVASLEPALPLSQVTTMPRLVDTSLAADRFTTALVGAFALVALALASVGIFGVFSADVAQRRTEIGVRLALGSAPSRLVGLLLRQALMRAAVGIAAGIALALALARSMTSLLFGVRAEDPLSLASVALLLFAVATAATLIPAVQAVRCSPVAILQGDS